MRKRLSSRLPARAQGRLSCLSLILALSGLPAAACAQGATDAVVLSVKQAQSIRVASARLRDFQPRIEAVGSIDYDQDRLVAIQPAVNGRVAEVLVVPGAVVRAGQPLLLLDSPDVNQAETALRTAHEAAAHDEAVVRRNQRLVSEGTLAARDLEQSQSDLRSAQIALESAREALRLLGVDARDIGACEAGATLHGRLPLRAPVAGRVTARAVSVGAALSPGMNPPPLVLGDLAKVWLIAQVAETDLPEVRIGAPVEATVPAYPGRRFSGRISVLGAGLDPATHHLAVRSEIGDPAQVLRPQMLAHFTISTGRARRSVGIPEAAVVREGDGTLNVWVATSGLHYERRSVRVGLSQAGEVEVLSGIAAGESVVVEGGLYLSNMHALQAP